MWYWARTSAIGSEFARVHAEAKNRKTVKAEVLVPAPPEIPADQVLYLSGSAPALGNWEAAGVPLERTPDGK